MLFLSHEPRSKGQLSRIFINKKRICESRLPLRSQGFCNISMKPSNSAKWQISEKFKILWIVGVYLKILQLNKKCGAKFDLETVKLSFLHTLCLIQIGVDLRVQIATNALTTALRQSQENLVKFGSIPNILFQFFTMSLQTVWYISSIDFVG